MSVDTQHQLHIGHVRATRRKLLTGISSARIVVRTIAQYTDIHDVACTYEGSANDVQREVLTMKRKSQQWVLSLLPNCQQWVLSLLPNWECER